MAGSRTKALAIAATASAALALAADARSGDKHAGEPSDRAAKGGTLTYFLEAGLPPQHTDPQRLYAGRDIANFSRTVYRSLVTFPVSEDVGIATTPVADLATDTGQSSQNARVWSFTVKDGVSWEDGRAITCADFKYGASRVFATDVIKDGPKYLLDYLDIPDDPRTGLPIYTGPYRHSAEGKAAFDKAITCDRNTITYHFKRPWVDFPLAIAALHMMDPYRADKDRGDDSNYEIFSNGPYRLESSWDKYQGGTLVRNDSYDPSTDSTDIRKALPDRIVFDAGKTSEQIAERLIDDRGPDKAAVTDERIPPRYYRRITGAVEERSVKVNSPYVEYLVPNFKRMTNPRVRQALAASTDVTGWIAAGGDQALNAATDIVNPVVTGYQKDLFPGDSGDPQKSRSLLEQAGVDTPYPIVFAYLTVSAKTDRQAEALKAGWEAGGFEVTLAGIKNPDTFDSTMQDPDQNGDVSLSGWGADWPSAITVTAPLFDSRPNLTETSTGSDWGNYRSTRFERLIDAAQQTTDLDEQTLVLQQADQWLAKDVAYIPLSIPVFYLLHGSRVIGYLNTAASNDYPDLGSIGVR